jgi:hypothetical protein
LYTYYVVNTLPTVYVKNDLVLKLAKLYTNVWQVKNLEPLQFQFGLAKLELDLARLIFRTGTRTRKETR